MRFFLFAGILYGTCIFAVSFGAAQECAVDAYAVRTDTQKIYVTVCANVSSTDAKVPKTIREPAKLRNVRVVLDLFGIPKHSTNNSTWGGFSSSRERALQNAITVVNTLRSHLRAIDLVSLTVCHHPNPPEGGRGGFGAGIPSRPIEVRIIR